MYHVYVYKYCRRTILRTKIPKGGHFCSTYSEGFRVYLCRLYKIICIYYDRVPVPKAQTPHPPDHLPSCLRRRRLRNRHNLRNWWGAAAGIRNQTQTPCFRPVFLTPGGYCTCIPAWPWSSRSSRSHSTCGAPNAIMRAHSARLQHKHAKQHATAGPFAHLVEQSLAPPCLAPYPFWYKCVSWAGTVTHVRDKT